VFGVRDHPPVSIAVEQVDLVAPFVLRFGKGSEAADFDAWNSCRVAPVGCERERLAICSTRAPSKNSGGPLTDPSLSGIGHMMTG
jgi:hypothetical protein